MPERTLTERELNRALLARQLLLERVDLPLPRALERVGGLQTQYAPTAYIGLWSRVAGFERDQLTRALECGSVVQATLMRATIHMTSRRDYPLFAEGVREARREWWLGVSRRELDARTLAATARRVRSLLADGPLTRTEIMERLGLNSVMWNGVGMFVDLVRVPPSGTWERRRADLFTTAEDWLGPSKVTREEGIEHLVRRYLGGFGPASRRDVASFTGLPQKMLAPTLERLGLRRFRGERGEELLDLPRAPLPDPDSPAPIRFLGTWEASLLVHARRTQILPERYRPMVFETKTPRSVQTFLVDGRVAGTWNYEHRRVKLKPFEQLPKAVRRELDDEAEQLAAFHA